MRRESQHTRIPQTAWNFRVVYTRGIASESNVITYSSREWRLIQRRIIMQAAVFCIGLLQAASAQAAAGSFAPLESWKSAILSGDSGALQAMYSANPPAQVATAAGQSDADSEISFWTGLKARRIMLDIAQSASPQPGIHQIVFEAEVHAAGAPARTIYVSEAQMWQQQPDGQWRLLSVKRTNPARLEQPLSTSDEIYPPTADAHEEINHALAKAAAAHKHVIVVFGANWCFDCHVLDRAFHRPDVEPLLKRNYEVVHVDVGRGEKNQDLMQQYQVPMKRGIPGLAVLDSKGRLLYSQKNGEFENARSMAPEDVLQFLNKWKPQPQ